MGFKKVAGKRLCTKQLVLQNYKEASCHYGNWHYKTQSNKKIKTISKFS
jgi:hypothetical protein